MKPQGKPAQNAVEQTPALPKCQSRVLTLNDLGLLADRNHSSSRFSCCLLFFQKSMNLQAHILCNMKVFAFEPTGQFQSSATKIMKFHETQRLWKGDKQSCRGQGRCCNMNLSLLHTREPTVEKVLRNASVGQGWLRFLSLMPETCNHQTNPEKPIPQIPLFPELPVCLLTTYVSCFKDNA